MTHPTFTFGNALSHYTKTGGPKGFLRAFAFTYAILSLISSAVSMALQWPVYKVYIRMITEGGDPVSYAQEIEAASMGSMLMSVLLMPVGILIWMVFEGASQRRYMRAEGFRLRIGADEWRLLVVGLIWVGLLIAAYIALIIAIIIPMVAGAVGGERGAIIGAAFAFLIFIAFFIAALYFVARLSAASALTVRDQQIRFFESWNVTREHGWTIVGAWVVLGLIMTLIAIVVYGVLAVAGIGLFAAIEPGFLQGDLSSDQVAAAFSNPVFWAPLAILLFLAVAFQAAFIHVSAGPAALAARNDPNWVGNPGIADEF